MFVYTNTNISCLNVETNCSSGSRRYWCSKGLHNVPFVVVDLIFLTMRLPVAWPRWMHHIDTVFQATNLCQLSWILCEKIADDSSIFHCVRKLRRISDNHLSCLDFVPGCPLQHSTYSVHSTFAVGCCTEIPTDVVSMFLLWHFHKPGHESILKLAAWAVTPQKDVAAMDCIDIQ